MPRPKGTRTPALASPALGASLDERHQVEAVECMRCSPASSVASSSALRATDPGGPAVKWRSRPDSPT